MSVDEIIEAFGFKDRDEFYRWSWKDCNEIKVIYQEMDYPNEPRLPIGLITDGDDGRALLRHSEINEGEIEVHLLDCGYCEVYFPHFHYFHELLAEYIELHDEWFKMYGAKLSDL